ncbi:aminopeptidase P family protein (plasmid) [Bosea sp. F3-2]|uniref:M24 family metallopeptidase n=1 Tax=Bosea sp. F3-2 TaxID=2599640 RepID=UPI0011EF95F2|nr:Xaa-Pro peptidase family protein [Bosea sp. F3-2]QEL27065.1 aminopeptidase P family protein [Bosea sp. F3-2]
MLRMMPTRQLKRLAPADVSLPAPPTGPTPQSEFDDRLNRLRIELAKAGIDAVVITERNNFEYFTGYRTMTWSYNARPLQAVITLRDVIVVGSTIEERNVASTPRPFSARFYRGYAAEGALATIEAVADAIGLANARIGVDYGQDMLGRGSLSLVDGIRARGYDLINAETVLWRVRMIKSRYEVELKRISLAIVDNAFDAVVAQARPGMSEAEFARQLQAHIALNGAERQDPISALFMNGDFVYSRPSGARPLRENDYVWTDFRSCYGGYSADRNRIARVGEPSERECALYAAVRGVTIELASSVRSGETCAEVHARFTRLWIEAGLPSVYGAVSRIGHGGGREVTEPPSISRDDHTVIEPGMVLHLEPKLEAGGGVFQFEECVYIDSDGPEFVGALSPETMPVIPL